MQYECSAIVENFLRAPGCTNSMHHHVLLFTDLFVFQPGLFTTTGVDFTSGQQEQGKS